MPRFFSDSISGDFARITGEDAAHIVRSLRMGPGEALTVCDGAGTDYACVIDGASEGCVTLRVLSRAPSAGEPTVRVTLMQCLPKGDKLDAVVQKAVELGVHEIRPVLSRRCVSRPDERAARKKTERWNRIALEAAKQCGRGAIPRVEELLPFEDALALLSGYDAAVLFYEGGGEPLDRVLPPQTARAALLIGPEGGFEPDEVELARRAGARTATLGPRILRTETAPVAALTLTMFLTGNLNAPD